MQLNDNSTFSIIVPLFNEEENIFPLVQTITKTVGENPNFLEIVLVDDGSTDATATLALNLAEQDSRIRLVRLEANRGLGAALTAGLSAARGDFVLYTDADLPFDFTLIPQLLALANENCVVSGYRLNRGEGGRRWVLTKVYNALIRLFFGFALRDVNFACKIFPQRFLRAAEFNSAGSFIDAEILLESRRHGLNIVEYPLVYYPRTRGLSTLSRPQVIFFILREMFSYTTGLFSDQNKAVKFIAQSPLAKSAICSTAMLISLAFYFESLWSFQAVSCLLLTLSAAVSSFLLGWRAVMLTVISVAAAAEFWLIRQNQPFLSPPTFYFVACALLGIVLSRAGYGGWKSARQSPGLNVSK